MHHINKQYQIDKSPNAGQRHTPIRPTPINAFPQHRQLCRGPSRARHCPRTNGGQWLAILGTWPWKPPPLQDLVVKAKTLAVPVEQLQSITTSPATTQRRRYRGRVLLRRLHAAYTAWINRVSAAASTPVSNRKQRPLLKESSTADGGMGSGADDTTSAIWKSIGRKTAPSPVGQSPFFLSSCRHL